MLYTQGQNSYKIPSKEFVFSTTADCKPSRSPKILLTIFLKDSDHAYRTAKQLLSEYRFLPNTFYCLLLYLYHFCWIFSWINHASSCLYFFSASDRISSSSSGLCFFGQEDGKDIFVLSSFQKEKLLWERGVGLANARLLLFIFY